MGERHAIVTCFLRHRGEVLLCRRAEDAGTYPGRWAAISGYVEEPDPTDTARREIREETGISDPELVRTGAAFPVHDPALDTEWTVHPFLFAVADPTLELTDEHASCEWTTPTAILERDTVPELWTSYERIAPTVETIREDRTHGAASLSIRALEVLRDGAAVVQADGRSMDDVTDLAERLLAARPSMVVLQNRVNRVMAEASAPREVVDAAIAGIDRALAADERAAGEAADLVTDATVLTLSRSGTVLTALRNGEPAHILVAESRPDREGIGVAEALAAVHDRVTVCTDAAIAHVLSTHAVDAVLVGADTIAPDGTVVNKTGTRAAALAADHEGIPVYVVAATDKVSPATTVPLEDGDPTAVYDGDAAIEALNPTFDRTPSDLITGVVTERGTLTPDALADVAAEHDARRDW